MENPETGSCRICWGSESEDENPLLKPCSCKAADLFFHLDCLKDWIGKKIRSADREMAITFNFSQF